MNRAWRVAIVSVGAALAFPAVGLTGDLPSGAHILDEYVKSTGGKAAYLRVNNRVQKLKMTLQPMNMVMDVVQYTAAPNQSYSKMESPAMVIEEGVSGDTVWMIHPFMGAQIRTGNEGAARMREAHMHKEVQWRELYDEVKCTEVVEYDKMPCYKVILTPKEGNDEIAYYEKDTWLLRGAEMKTSSPGGEAVVTTKLRKYKEFDGILYPHEMEQGIEFTATGMKQTFVIAVESIEHNADIPQDRFNLPEPIKALLAEQTPE